MSAPAEQGPPSYNMGVTSQVDDLDNWNKDRNEVTAPNTGCTFDWYQATFPGPDYSSKGPDGPASAKKYAKDLVTRLADELKPARVNHVERGLHGYTDRTLFTDARGGTTLMVLHGRNPCPNVTATSYRADAFADLARAIEPEHRVTRVDVAIDFCQEDAWKDSLKRCQFVMSERNLTSGRIMQPDRAENGATYYMGSATSPVMARLYQKGYEQQKRFPDSDADPDWVRLELQVRPQKEAKTTFAKASRDEVWGATKWSRDLIEMFRGWSPAGLRVAPRTETEFERTQRFLMKQYAGHMGEGGALAWLPVERFLREGGMSDLSLENLSKSRRRQAFDMYMKRLGDEVFEYILASEKKEFDK